METLPELQRLRWIPWLQVAGLFLTFLVGVLVVRAQRRAEADRAWTAMARELAHQLGTPISSLQGWLEVLRLPGAERPRELGDDAIAAEIGEDVERLERVSRRFELIGRRTPLAPSPSPTWWAGGSLHPFAHAPPGPRRHPRRPARA
jgi:signal transduction histidine kinase